MLLLGVKSFLDGMKLQKSILEYIWFEMNQTLDEISWSEKASKSHRSQRLQIALGKDLLDS